MGRRPYEKLLVKGRDGFASSILIFNDQPVVILVVSTMPS
jgi:hypothetical protein